MGQKKVKEFKRKETASAVEELKAELERMTIKRDEALKAYRDQLIEDCVLTSSKWLTVSGFMMAKSALQDVLTADEANSPSSRDDAMAIAESLSIFASQLAEIFSEAEEVTIDYLDYHYDPEFVLGTHDAMSIALELLKVELIRSIKQVIEKMESEKAGMNHDIDNTREKLKTLTKEPKEKTEAAAEPTQDAEK